MIPNHVALIAYPLSGAYRKRFEDAVGQPLRYLGLGELRRMSPAGSISSLASLRAGKVWIPLEDEGSFALLPVLSILAAVMSAGEVEVVGPDLSPRRLHRPAVAGMLAAVAASSLAGQADLALCRRELAGLLRQGRLAVARPEGRNVLYLKTNLWFGVKAGGSVGHVAGVVNSLARRGYHVDFAACERAPLLDASVRFHRMAAPRHFALPSEANLFRFQRSFAAQAAALPARRRYAFLYQRMSVANYVGVTLSRRYGVPLVLEYNGSEVWIHRHWGRAMRYHRAALLAEEACLRHAHLIVTVSRVLREELLARGLEDRRVVFHPNGIDPAVFDPGRFPPAERDALRRRYGIAQDAAVVLFIGTFGQWHGVDVLAEAIVHMARQCPDWLAQRKVHFLLVGDGLKMPQVRETLAEPCRCGLVTLTGLVPQEEAPGFLAAADVLLSPHVPNPDGSRFFGSPTKLYEYMAMGKGIVASDLEQIGETLGRSLRVESLPAGSPAGDENALAVLARPGDVDALARGIRFLVDHPAWANLLGRNARTEALNRYTWDHHVEKVLSAL